MTLHFWASWVKTEIQKLSEISIGGLFVCRRHLVASVYPYLLYMTSSLHFDSVSVIFSSLLSVYVSLFLSFHLNNVLSSSNKNTVSKGAFGSLWENQPSYFIFPSWPCSPSLPVSLSPSSFGVSVSFSPPPSRLSLPPTISRIIDFA